MGDWRENDDAGILQARAAPERNAIITLIQGNPKTVDACLYLIFLVIFTAVVFNTQGAPTDATPYLMAANIRAKWGADFDRISDASGWFDYMEKTFAPLTFPNRWYNGDSMSPDDMGWAGGHPEMYRLIGEVSVRQVRVSPGTCSVRPTLASLVPVCYGEYSSETESQQAFGPVLDVGGKPRYGFTTAEINGENSFVGQANTYNGGGFRTSVPSKTSNITQGQAITLIRQLRDTRWIDRQTRAVFTDMSLYNPATDILSVIKLSCEFPPSGGALPRLNLRNLRAEQLWPRGKGTAEIALESILLVIVLAYVATELRLMYRMGLSPYFGRFWGIYDWVNFLLFFISYGFRYRALALAVAVKFPPDQGVFVNYESPAFAITQWKNIMAINAFITWIKFFKYLESVPFMSHLLKVFYTALPDTIGFIGALVAVFTGFGLAHFLAYGDDIYDFRTLSASFVSLYRMVLGDFKVEELERSNRILGPAFFVLWTLITTLLLLNIFIAIVVDAYDRVRQQVDRVSFTAFMKDSALPPVQDMLKKLQALAGGDEDEDDEDEDAQGAAAKKVLEGHAAAEMSMTHDGGMGGGGGGRREGGGGDGDLVADEKLELVLQAVLTLSREVRVLSRRVKALTDTAGPGQVPAPTMF